MPPQEMTQHAPFLFLLLRDEAVEVEGERDVQWPFPMVGEEVCVSVSCVTSMLLDELFLLMAVFIMMTCFLIISI